MSLEENEANYLNGFSAGKDRMHLELRPQKWSNIGETSLYFACSIFTIGAGVALIIYALGK